MTHPIEQAADAVERELADLRAKLAVAVEALGDMVVVVTRECDFDLHSAEFVRRYTNACAKLAQIKGE